MKLAKLYHNPILPSLHILRSLPVLPKSAAISWPKIRVVADTPKDVRTLESPPARPSPRFSASLASPVMTGAKIFLRRPDNLRLSIFANPWRTVAGGMLGYVLSCTGVSGQAPLREPVADTGGHRGRGAVVPEESLVYWSKRDFTIPFHVDPTGQQPAEVRLEVSIDQGRQWVLYARDDLTARQFRFQAQHDGLHLFRIMTVDGTGGVFDSGSEPLKVVVDTESPDLSLSVDTDERGAMVADFHLRDTNPAPDQIRLEFQTDRLPQWTAIPWETTASLATEFSGRGRWEVPIAARQLVVRLVARDAAGNESELTRLPQLPRTAAGHGNLQLASGAPTPRFSHSYPAASLPDATKAPASGSQAPLPSGVNRSPSASAQARIAPPVATQAASSPAWPPRNSPPPPTPPKQLPPPTTSMVSNQGAYNLRSLDETLGKGEGPPGNEVLFLESDPRQNAFPGPSKANAPAASKLEPGYLPLPSQASALGSESPPTRGEKPFYSKAKSFSLDYEVNTPATAPVTAIELWGTADGGKIWERWGTDPDGQSPLDIQVAGEGLFGFRMVVVAANGLAGNRPRNGDNADAWVHVDTQVPLARIQSALHGKGAEAGGLVIEYTARDDYFGEKPITFLYSELPTGPWTTIATGLPNSGRFVWKADPNLPPRVYLKLEAFDEAGNVGEHRMDLPVDMEGLRPRGRIQGFRPRETPLDK